MLLLMSEETPGLQSVKKGISLFTNYLVLEMVRWIKFLPWNLEGRSLDSPDKPNEGVYIC